MVEPGYPVVLTADRTLTAGYDLLFDGMLAAGLTTTTPAFLRPLLLPRPLSPRAPLGLRRIEAALIAGGFLPGEVEVVDEDGLDAAIGPATRVVGISAGEPCGGGMNSSTMVAVAGGRIWPRFFFERLLSRVRRLVAERAPMASVVLGGPGAWQAVAAPPVGVDAVVTGYADGNAAALFRRWCDGEHPPLVAAGVGAQAIPAIRGPTTMGVVELSRGCGFGCGFCTIADTPMRHLPVGTIVADVQTNLRAGQSNIALLSEDLFRFGGQGARPDPAALIALLRRLRELPGLGLIQVDHVNLCSVARFSDADLRQVRDLLGGGRSEFVWVNVGVETANGELLSANGGAAKMGGAEASGWGDFAATQVRRLIAAGFFPLASLVVGLPGETADDISRTREWVAAFAGQRLAIFPVIFAPIDGSPPPALRRNHWRLMRESYAFNFRWIPRLFADQQRAVGVGWLKRAFIQLLGRGQIIQWSALLAWRRFRAQL